MNVIKKDLIKAVDIYIKGMTPPTEFYTFQLEFYARKCRRRVRKLIRSNQDLYDHFFNQLEGLDFFARNS